MEMIEKNKIKGSLTEFSKEFSENYKKLSSEELERLKKKEQEDRVRYEDHLALVKKYIFDVPFKEKISAYSIFLEEKLLAAQEKGNASIEETKKKAKFESDNTVTSERRKIYEEKLESDKIFLEEELRNTKRIPNASALYVKDQFARARIQGKTMTLKVAMD